MTQNGVSPCQVCETDRHAHILLRLPDGSFARCSACGFVYLNGERSLDEQHGIYQADQFEGEGYMGSFEMAEIAEEQVGSVRAILERAGADTASWASDQPHLDVGCARGYFLRAFTRATGNKNALGVDTSPGMTEWGRKEFGLDLRTGAIEFMDLPTDHYGLVTMFDVLEHVAFPRTVLGKIVGSLRPGGWMVIEVPSEITSFRILTRFAHRVSGGRLVRPVAALYHPFHLSYFTPTSLKSLIASLGGQNVTMVTKEAHITRFGISRYPLPARLAIRSVTLLDQLLGTQAKLLCVFQRPAA